MKAKRHHVQSQPTASNGKHAASEQVLARDDRRGAPRPVSQEARSRASVSSRHESTRAYARFAVDAARDLMDGEPLEVFREIGRLDTILQRKIDHELRREVFIRLTLPHAAPQVAIEAT